MPTLGRALPGLAATDPPATLRRRIYRPLILFGRAVLSIVLAIVSVRLIIVPLAILCNPAIESSLYDWAVFGAYPQQSYVSFDLVSPLPSVAQWDDSCSRGLVLLDLHGRGVSDLGPYITDMKGNLVWMSDEYGWATNLKVQHYLGQPYLTFWAGKKLTESGQGKYYMLDASYSLVYTVSAVGDGLYGDLHEFVITESGTALMTVYDRRRVDLSATNMSDRDGRIVDCVVQEVDVATNELLFEWRASDHIADGPYLTVSSGGAVDGDGPIDYFHINSVEKDSYGNYLMSVRHMHSIIYVDGSGSIMWALGGPQSDFQDVSDAPAINFHWQHDARWTRLTETRGTMTVFDNGIAKHHTSDAEYSRGLVIEVDFRDMTASLLHEYTSLDRTATVSQGSVQLLETETGAEHALVGWGSHAAFSEFTLEGELLCETHFAPSLFFFLEMAKSYRAIKTTEWVGIPSWDPSAELEGSNLYVSWNGATQVEYWALQGGYVDFQADDDLSAIDEDSFEELDIIFKDAAFECAFDLSMSSGGHAAYRVAALDADRNVLRYSNVVIKSPTPLWTNPWAVIACVASVLVAITYLARGVGEPRKVWASAMKTFHRTSGYRRLGHDDDLELVVSCGDED